MADEIGTPAEGAATEATGQAATPTPQDNTGVGEGGDAGLASAGEPNAGQDGSAEGSTTPTFAESLPEQYRDNPRFKDVTSLEDLAKRLAEAPEKPVVPETLEGYDISSVTAIDQSQVTPFLTVAHNAGLTQDQVLALAEMEGKRLEAEFTAAKGEVAKLKEEWGDSWDENLKVANDAIYAVNERVPGLAEAFQKDRMLRNNPLVIKLFHEIGKAIGPDSFETGGTGKGGGGGKGYFASYDKTMPDK